MVSVYHLHTRKPFLIISYSYKYIVLFNMHGIPLNRPEWSHFQSEEAYHAAEQLTVCANW